MLALPCALFGSAKGRGGAVAPSAACTAPVTASFAWPVVRGAGCWPCRAYALKSFPPRYQGVFLAVYCSTYSFNALYGVVLLRLHAASNRRACSFVTWVLTVLRLRLSHLH